MSHCTKGSTDLTQSMIPNVCCYLRLALSEQTELHEFGPKEFSVRTEKLPEIRIGPNVRAENSLGPNFGHPTDFAKKSLDKFHGADRKKVRTKINSYESLHERNA